MIEVGANAPEFELANQTGDGQALRLPGKNVVLYFYPKADTPGCTVQACGVRDRGGEYARATRWCSGYPPTRWPSSQSSRRSTVSRSRCSQTSITPCGELRRVGGEVDVRTHLLGKLAHDVHHRP